MLRPRISSVEAPDSGPRGAEASIVRPTAAATATLDGA